MLSSLSVTLLLTSVSGLAGDETTGSQGGPFFSFQGISPVNSLDNKGFNAGVFYPISSFSKQIQFPSSEAAIPEAVQTVTGATIKRRRLPVRTNQNLAFDPAANEIQASPLANGKLLFDHHPEELLSMKLIEKIKAKQRIPEDLSPFLEKKFQEISFRKKLELKKKLKQGLPVPANRKQAFSLPLTANERPLSAVTTNQEIVLPANTIATPQIKVDFQSGRYFFSY